MYSKVKVLGHPVHPMLVAYPIALYTATLVSYVVFVLWGHGDYAWMKLAIAANVGGVAMAAVAAVPGLVDWATGIPAGSPARRHGLVHLALNAAALGLFLIDALLHVGDWQQTNHPHTAAGVILAALGVLCTIGAGFFGWTMVQTDGVGVDLSPAGTRVERAARESGSRSR